MGKWIRCLLSKPFNPACIKHDKSYENKNGTQQDIDIEFLKDCLKIARGRFLLEVYACLFFILIRIGGKFSWVKEK